MRITITCESCGRRHRLERTVIEDGPIWIVCHSCEIPLRAALSARPVAERDFVAAWRDFLDIGSNAAA